MPNRRTKIVLSTIGSLGDLHPMIAIALALKERGHETVIATSEGYREKIGAIGLPFHTIRPHFDVEDPDFFRKIMDLKKGPEHMIRTLLLPHLRDTYEDVAAITADADFLLAGEIVFPAPLLGEKNNLKWASVILSPMSFFSPYDPPVIAPYASLAPLRKMGVGVNRAFMNFGRLVTKSWGEPIRQLRKELGLQPTPHPIMEDKFSADLVLALFSKVLGPPQPDWPDNTLQPGFVFYDRNEHDTGLSPQIAEFLDAGEPPIVFTLGSAAVMDAGNFYEESAEAAAMLKRRAILLVGENPPPAALPAGVIAADYAPFSELLPRAAAVVHQGGVGTTAQVLRAGRPQVVMPYAFDQPDNAARVESLGTGRVIPRKKYRAARAAREIAAILGDPAYARRATEVQTAMSGEPGVAAVVSKIETMMAP